MLFFERNDGAASWVTKIQVTILNQRVTLHEIRTTSYFGEQ